MPSTASTIIGSPATTPLGVVPLISDRVSRVTLMLGNRTDLDSRITSWLCDSYRELGMTYHFEELVDTVEETLVAGQTDYAYPTTDTTKGSLRSGYSTRAIKALTIINPSNGNRIPLRYRDEKYIDRYPVLTTNWGPPSIYADYGKQAILRPPPDLTYTLIWRIWCEPLIDQVTAANTMIFLPNDWLEILDYGAALRGHTELLERDKATELHNLLYGSEDPRTGRRVPGLIAQRLMTKSAAYAQQEYGIRPNIRSFTSR